MSRQLPVNRFTTTAQGLVPAPLAATGTFLRDDGTWAAVPGFASPLTTKGDIFGFDTVNNRIPVGADGTVLTADSSQALGVKWTAPTGSGTVTSVGLLDGSATPIYTISGSPVVGAGTLTYTFKTQAANTVLAGPTSGGVAQPAFRSLVAADGGIAGFGTVVTTLTQAGGASQNYAGQPNATTYTVICIGGGGGGGSGQHLGAAGTQTGGAGGGGGGISIATFRASDLTFPIAVTFSNSATGGNGGAPTTAVAQGNAGVAGSNASFGARLIAAGGAPAGGGASTGVGGAGGAGNIATGTSGGNGGAGGGVGVNGTGQVGTTFSPTSYGPTGGGGAGGNSATVAGAGGAGGLGNAFITLVGGTGGTTPGGNGGPGVAGSGTQPASGGGGGGASFTAGLNGGNGGAGGSFGAGGGGGGSAYTTATQSGGGGTGGPAACIIIAY